jgi:hypothetical protein
MKAVHRTQFPFPNMLLPFPLSDESMASTQACLEFVTTVVLVCISLFCQGDVAGDAGHLNINGMVGMGCQANLSLEVSILDFYKTNRYKSNFLLPDSVK